ncbi:unnamed protein product [Mytilus coruscus]|uniref:Uncharacterized protein n=1 Tax=Mytilus coruscus TaxID=42192 RepID=A0A6J8C042_MYTCO|nr:unnamed protein product [Mytilus coruscus]
MGMSNAERQRKFRENRNKDLVKREAYLNKEKERYQKEKRTGKKKSVKDMTEREKRSARKKWRTAKHKERSAKKTLLKLMTPPNTPESSPNLQPGPSRQKVQSVKKRNRDQAKCYRDNKILEDKLAKQKRKIQMYKQRYLREKRKGANFDKPCPDTPRTKTKKLLRNFSQKEVKTSLSRRICRPVREFYERNDVSRLSTGVKQTVTFKKIKKQRRILLDTLQNIHLKFLAESNTKVSYSTFCRLRPFWVVFPNESDRSTCLCKLCENTKYIANALKKSNIIETDELEKIIDGLTCDQDTYLLKRRCMFGTCEVCKNNRISYDTSKGNDEVEFSQWTSMIEKRLVKEEEKNITLTVKEPMEMSASDLVNKFEDELVRFKKHVFTIRAQYGYFKNRKQSLKKDECLLHIDFSENYVCKMSEEIQSMHFGASKKQLSLHTGVYYVSNYQKTFCTVSENLQHGPAGIWAHLKPILKRIKQESPGVTSLKYSVMDQQPTGHGKGIPDAVGGALKRHADTEVKFGKDITNADIFLDCMSNSESVGYLVSDRDIQKNKSYYKQHS